MPSANAPAGNQPPANQPAPSAPAGSPAANSQPAAEAAPKADSGTPPDGAAASTKNSPAPEETPANKNHAQAAKSDESEDDGDSAPAEAPPKPKTAPTPVAKPRATIRPVDSIAEARKYVYGKGASQDCDRGLRLLKPMANEGNAKAMVEMGALYSAGLCTPRDLPTSYRWFAMALRKDPSNESIQADLQKLWGEMTQPERQLAIKLTQ
jgi:DedD protein